MNPPRSFLQAAIVPALLVGSALGSEVCKNDQAGAGQDSGCSERAPICVDQYAKEPAKDQPGIKCAPCLNHYDNPAEPDWGCSSAEPLCVLTDEEPTTRKLTRRPQSGTAGTMCAPYPCRNTKRPGWDVDEGCTPEYPTCVDALGNNPILANPGVECVAATEVPKVAFSREGSTAAWGVSSKSKGCLLFGQDLPPAVGSKSGVSVCNGCPFGISKQCDIAKLSW